MMTKRSERMTLAVIIITANCSTHISYWTFEFLCILKTGDSCIRILCFSIVQKCKKGREGERERGEEKEFNNKNMWNQLRSYFSFHKLQHSHKRILCGIFGCKRYKHCWATKSFFAYIIIIIIIIIKLPVLFLISLVFYFFAPVRLLF